MADTAQKQDKSERPDGWWAGLNRLDRLVATAAAIGAVLSTAFGTLATTNKIALDKVQARLTSLDNERNYATQIYTNFDAIVSGTSPEQVRIDRLNGLIALTELVADGHENEALKKRLAAMIQAQSDRYAASLANTPNASPQVVAQIAQYRALGRQAAVVAKASTWANYDFDVFWCSDGPNAAASRALATQVLGLKATDPAAAGLWRLRSLDKATAARLKVSGYSIRWDYPDEQVVAARLQGLIAKEGIGPSNGSAFRIDVAAQRTTPWYLSVFICPA